MPTARARKPKNPICRERFLSEMESVVPPGQALLEVLEPS